MANSKSRQKNIRQNIKHRSRNRWRRVTMRAAIKEFHDKVAHGSADDATESFRACCAIIDRTAQKGVIHRNQAARRKSRMSTTLKAKQGT